MAWLTGWAKRVKLTTDQADIDADLANFPILLYLSTSSGRNPDDISFIFDELQSDANRKKIAVTTSDGTTECYVEIEKWDDANEKAWLWVKAPSIAGATDTDLYLYYDSTHADNTAYVGDPNSTPAENVWDADFKFVSHMRDDPDTSHIRDSTSNNRDGTKKGAAEPAVTTSGKVADAQTFDGGDDVIDLGTGNLALGQVATLEAWIKFTDNTVAWQVILFLGTNASGQGIYLVKNANPAHPNPGTGIVAGVYGESRGAISGPLNDGAWHHVVGRFFATNQHAIHVDGSLFESNTSSLTINQTGTVNKIGFNFSYWPGGIDEVRISNIARSAAWIKATYETARDHLLDWGSEEQESTPKLSEVTYPLGWSPDKALAAALSSEQNYPLAWTPGKELDATLASEKTWPLGWTSDSSVAIEEPKSSQNDYPLAWTPGKELQAEFISQQNWPLAWTPDKALEAATSSQQNYPLTWTPGKELEAAPSSANDYPLGWTPDKALDAALSSEKSWPLGWTPDKALDAALSSQKDYSPGWTSESSREIQGGPVSKQSEVTYHLGWTSSSFKGNIVWKGLSDTLLAAQKKPHRLPYVEAKVYDYEAGIKRLSWTSLYTGSEADNHHGIAFDGQGSMHRIRAAAGSKLYYQKVTSPGPSSDFSQWTEIAADCDGPCAIAAYGAKVYIFYRTSTNVLWKYYSHDYGQSWNNAQLSSHTAVLSMAACWKGTTDIVVCFAATSIQIIAIVLDTTTQSATPYVHNHALDTIYGIGATFRDGEFPIIFAASDTVGATVLYALYASRLSAAYNFLAPYPLLTAHDDQNTIFTYPDCHSPPSPYSHETLCLTAVESYSGITSYNRPLFSHLVKDTYWSDATIIEPRFFLPISSAYGVRLITDSSYWWLSMPGGLWRAPRAADSPVDLTPYITRVRHLVQALSPGGIQIELDNSKAHFVSPPPNGSEIVLRLGYKTTAGAESSNAGHYWIDSSRFTSSENTSVLIINATDIWGLAARWSARYVLRWNYTSPPVPCRVWAILYQLLGRFGIRLWNNGGVPQSDPMNNFYPKYLVRGGSQGHTQVRRILSFVTDGLIQREAFAFVKDLLPTESPCYEYRNDRGYHPILKGEYDANLTITHAQVSGETEEVPPTPVREAAFDWENLLRGIDTLVMEYDPNLEETDQAAKRAVALLRHEAQKSLGGQIIIPTNCGQELYDVISVNDPRVPLGSRSYRVLAIQTDYDRRNGRYEQKLTLGAP